MDTEHFKRKLVEEKGHLEADLNYIGEKEKSGSYHARPAETDETGFRDEVADRLEELGGRVEAEGSLEARLISVTHALERMEAGTYGVCEVCKKEIEKERLEANPAARTCIEHIASESTLS